VSTRVKSAHVFINCPFGTGYQPIFSAIVFAVYDLGFVARCSLEDDDAGEVRLTKIQRIVEECRYGINDLSTVTLDTVTGLPRFNMPLASGDTSKPASRGHLKTGQLSASRTVIVLPHRWHFRQEFFKLNLPSAPNSVYTDLTWAEDRATQGCDPSADPAAGMAGRRQPPQKRTAILAENAVNPRGLGTASPTKESLLPIWFSSREAVRPHVH
jgi:hypothetical protein